MSYQKSCACHATTAEIIDAIVVHGRIACVLLHDSYLRIQLYSVCPLLFHCIQQLTMRNDLPSIHYGFDSWTC